MQVCLTDTRMQRDGDTTPKHTEFMLHILPESLARIVNDHSLTEVLMALSVFISVNHETEEEKTDAVSDTSLPSSDLVDLLLSEAKELLAPILSNKDGKHSINWRKLNPSECQGSLSVLLAASSTFQIFPYQLSLPDSLMLTEM